MKLPKINIPIYEVILPISRKKITYRPFLVKEEKILLMAMEAADKDSILLAIKQIATNCIQDEIDLDDIPIVDIEYLFLHIRARSIGEVINLQYKCNNEIGSKKSKDICNEIVDISINILDITPTTPKISNKIELESNIGMVLGYPTFRLLDMNIQDEVTGISEMIDYIYDSENIYYPKDILKAELEEFINNLTNTQYQKIKDFLNDLPVLEYNVTFKCPKCGYTKDIKLVGIQDFF